MMRARACVASDQDGRVECLSSDDFRRVAEFVRHNTGIRLPPSKRVMVEGRLRRRVRALGLDSLAEYCSHLFDQGGMEREAVNLIDAMTTNKTDFFRERQHFDFLTGELLPALTRGRERTAKLWSAACSIGAEPYTLAMVLSEYARENPGFGFSIVASDISTDVLEKAERAIYPEDMIDPVPMDLRQRYVLRSIDPSKGVVRMAPEIRSQVRFLRINLMEECYPIDRDMDIIFCRNLLIYFEKETQEMVVRRLCRHLRPGGYLFIGHADSIAGMNLPLTWLGNSIYRLSGDAKKNQGPHRR